MNRNKLFYRTRNVGFLWKTGLMLGLAIVAAGSLVSLLNDHEPSPVDRVYELMYVEEGFDLVQGHETLMADAVNGILRDCLAGKQPFYEKLEDFRRVIQLSPVQTGLAVPEYGVVSNLSSNEYGIASALGEMGMEAAGNRTLTGSELKSSRAAGQLESLAAQPVQYANLAWALAFRSLDPEASELALQREIELFNEDDMRERLVGYYLHDKEFDKLGALKSDPAFDPYIDAYVEQEIALSRMDWPELVRTLIPAAYEDVNLAMVFLALVSGLIWAVIVLRFNGAISVRSAPVRLAIPALLLGALSAHATILFIFLQENQLHLGLGPEPMGQFAYCLGIGFREEGLKLLFFCPLIPFLWRKADLEILTVAGLVGLGFAIEENINYFEGSAGISALGRFATANFLHIAWTAMGGLTLLRACIYRGRDIQVAAVTFASIVAFHGLYDAFLIVDLLGDYAWLSFTVFILLGYQYFGWLRHLRDEWKDPVSITSVFTLGLVVVTGLSYGLFAWQAGITDAFQVIAREVIQIAIILFMFYREIPETLQH